MPFPHTSSQETGQTRPFSQDKAVATFMAVRLDKIQPRSILLIKPSALGDICHSLPVLDFLRARFPEAAIHWIVNKPFAPLLEAHPSLRSVLLFDRTAGKKGIGNLLSSTWSLVGRLRSVKPDLVIDLQGLLRTGFMSLATLAPVRIGLADSREGSRLGYTHRVAIPVGIVHAVDRYWQVAKALGATEPTPVPRLPIQPAWKEEADKILTDLPRPWTVLGPGSRWVTKRWLPAHFAEIGRRIFAERGGSVLLIGTPDEAHLSHEVNNALKGQCLDLTGKTSLGGLTGILSQADLVVANDTGPLHLAVAVGAKVASPFTCTSIAKTGPFGQLDNAVATTVDCAASFLRECPNMKCMRELTADRLWPVIKKTLDEVPR